MIHFILCNITNLSLRQIMSSLFWQRERRKREKTKVVMFELFWFSIFISCHLIPFSNFCAPAYLLLLFLSFSHSKLSLFFDTGILKVLQCSSLPSSFLSSPFLRSVSPKFPLKSLFCPCLFLALHPLFSLFSHFLPAPTSDARAC